MELRQLFAVLTKGLLQVLSPLGLGAVLLSFYDLPLELLHQAQNAAGSQLGQGLRRGEQLRPPDVLGPPLVGRVKESHAVHLVSPELRPDRGVHVGGEHIQNAAPEGELAGALHLLAADIARRRQHGRKLLQIAALPRLQPDSGLAEGLRRNGPL